MEGLGYAETKVPLALGDSLTLYTDGLNEAANEAGDLFTIKRIQECVRAVSGGPQVLGQTVMDSVSAFVGQAAQTDDMCLVSFGRLR
jgi:sigma-B regulation protein RsbU (phosphoserine phosphatase)